MTADKIMTVTSFAVSIGLGVISISLAIFAIWLSRHFDTKSSSALDMIKDLASEIRNLTRVQLSQQQNFSTKMLDSILSHSGYGAPTQVENQAAEPAIVELMREELTRIEQRINSSVEAQVRGLVESKIQDPSQIEDVLSTIRGEISRLGDNAIQAVGETVRLPDRVKKALMNFRDGGFPAYFALLPAIVREDATSPNEIQRLQQKYAIPEGWKESGLATLIDVAILEGNKEKFRVAPDAVKPLKVWVEKNWQIISQLIDMYRHKKGEAVSEEELSLVKNLSI